MKMVQHSFGAGGRPSAQNSDPGGRSATLCPRQRSGIGRAVFGALAALILAAGGCGGSWQGSIGAVLAKDNKDGRLYVRETPADMGAARAGLLPGDEVLAIEGKATKEMSAEQVHQALHGDVGTKVSLTVSRKGVERTLSVERGPLKASDGGA